MVGIDKEVFDRCEAMIKKTASVISRRSNDVLDTYEDLVQEGYFILIREKERREKVGDTLTSYYFGKRLWQFILSRKRAPVLSVELDVTNAIEDMQHSDMYILLGIQHMLELLPHRKRRVINMYLNPTPAFRNWCRLNGHKPVPGVASLASYYHIGRDNIKKWLGEFYDWYAEEYAPVS